MTLRSLALIAIGRNEGHRLERCLDSVRTRAQLVIYVDSGSTDGSVAQALARGVEVVVLETQRPFTAARARNAGLQRVLELMPDVRWIQFVDGDCEVRAGWLERATAYLEHHPHVAAVFGRRRERFPDRSIYNRLCDMEWAIPPGPVKSCGGDVLFRARSLRETGGYLETLIAGEEPELCVRLRARGWQIHAIDVEMTLHDAAMTRFGQWWKRMARSGYAFAQGAHLHGAKPEMHWVRESRRAWFWGLVLPAGSILLAAGFGPSALTLLAMYPLQMTRQLIRQPGTLTERALKAVFQMLGRFPEMSGQTLFWRDLWLRRLPRLIEYK